jgi:predicted acyltransferase
MDRNLQSRFDTLPVAGVLQRIAACYGIAALISLFARVRTQVALLLAILVGYGALLMFVLAPETHVWGDLARETKLAGYIGRYYLPGKTYPAYCGYDNNEGLLSMVPAVATALLGVLAGQWLLLDRGRWSKAAGLAAMGVRCLGLGMLAGREFPVIKNLWTSSIVLVTGGWSLLALFYTIIDVMKLRARSFLLVAIGVDAITIYVGRRIIPFGEVARFLLGDVARYSNSLGPAVVPIGVLVVE